MGNRYKLSIVNAMDADNGVDQFTAVMNYNATKFATEREHELFTAIKHFELEISRSSNGPEFGLNEIITRFYRDRGLTQSEANTLAKAHLRGLAIVIDMTLRGDERVEEEPKKDNSPLLTTTEFVQIMARLNQLAPEMISEDLDKMVRVSKAFKAEFM